MYALNTSMNRTRSDYYEGNYTPHMFTNGFDSGSSLNAWVEDPKKYMNEVSFLELSFQGVNNNDNYNFAITAKSLINTDDSSDLRLFFNFFPVTVKTSEFIFLFFINSIITAGTPPAL